MERESVFRRNRVGLYRLCERRERPAKCVGCTQSSVVRPKGRANLPAESGECCCIRI
jgi:hypothetical protein